MPSSFENIPASSDTDLTGPRFWQTWWVPALECCSLRRSSRARAVKNSSMLHFMFRLGVSLTSEIGRLVEGDVFLRLNQFSMLTLSYVNPSTVITGSWSNAWVMGQKREAGMPSLTPLSSSNARALAFRSSDGSGLSARPVLAFFTVTAASGWAVDWRFCGVFGGILPVARSICLGRVTNWSWSSRRNQVPRVNNYSWGTGTAHSARQLPPIKCPRQLQELRAFQSAQWQALRRVENDLYL